MIGIDLDQAIDVIVESLRSAPDPTRARLRPPNLKGCDIWIPDLVSQVAQTRGDDAFSTGNEERQSTGKEERQAQYYLHFYDAVAELFRIGVLRPGPHVPNANYATTGANCDGYSLTAYGRRWVAARPEPMPRDPSRFMALLMPYKAQFGPGFIQRANEAINCYRTTNYLATCVMCGAATESVLLALAIAKVADEAQVLREYRAGSGRKKVTDLVAGKLKAGIREQLETFVRLLGFWRDEAGHGKESAITEAAANMSLLQLLRFSQFAADEWEEMTRANS